MTGAHSRSDPLALRAMQVITSTVTSALSGAAKAGEPFGTSSSMPKMMGITVTGISMMTVPATAGVSIRRISESRDERRNWKNDETSTRVASIAGPPLTRAVTQTAMNAPEVPMSSTCPAPKRPTRTACSTVVTPLMATAANTAQERNAFAAARGPDHDGRSQHDPGDAENGELEAQPEGQRQRRLLVGLITDVSAAVGVVGGHGVNLDGRIPRDARDPIWLRQAGW